MARRRRTSKKSIGTRARRGSPTRPRLHRSKVTDHKISTSPSFTPAHSAIRENPRPRYRTLTQTRNAAPSSPASSLSPSNFYSGGQLVSSPSKRLARPTVCESRRNRREVLFASGKAAGRVARPTFTKKSKVRC